MKHTHWMVRLVQIATVLFVLFACLMIFIYSPFYSKLVVKALNTFVPVEVNEVAAKSQQMAAFSDQDSLEPGSDLWIARQVYLKLMEQEIKSENSQNLTLIDDCKKLIPKSYQFRHTEYIAVRRGGIAIIKIAIVIKNAPPH